jgi:hypothetical protein
MFAVALDETASAASVPLMRVAADVAADVTESEEVARSVEIAAAAVVEVATAVDAATLTSLPLEAVTLVTASEAVALCPRTPVAVAADWTLRLAEARSTA